MGRNTQCGLLGERHTITVSTKILHIKASELTIKHYVHLNSPASHRQRVYNTDLFNTVRNTDRDCLISSHCCCVSVKLNRISCCRAVLLGTATQHQLLNAHNILDTWLVTYTAGSQSCTRQSCTQPVVYTAGHVHGRSCIQLVMHTAGHVYNWSCIQLVMYTAGHASCSQQPLLLMTKIWSISGECFVVYASRHIKQSN